ncbi:MAG TPA: hypothetical protein VK922_14170 [Gemmatimonadaceae bacterium]|nr:hypothetical protein [Gemmatimonadaceae bacterium]
MMRTLSRRLAMAGALMTVLAACGDTPTAPASDPAELANADVATVAGDQTFEDVAAMRHHQGLFGPLPGPLPRFGAWSDDCTFDGATESFVCPSRTHNGFTHTRSYRLFDEAGSPQSAYDPVTTASATFTSAMSGSATHDAFSATFTRQRTFTVSGLEGDETTHTWNGTGTATHSRTHHGDGSLTRSYAMTSSTTVTSVVLPFPQSPGSWPLSGTIVRQVSFTRDGAGPGRAGTRTVTVTFNGTQFVPMMVNQRAFTLDLATGRPVRD